MKWINLQKDIFPGQQEDEKICMVLRPHWMVFLMKFIIWLAFVAILIGSDWAINQYLPVLKTSPYVDYYTLARNVYLMFLVLGLLILWIMYYLDIQIITNERVVDIIQGSLLHRTVSELHLSRIEDVTSEVDGVLETLLDYGDVYIQTAGTTEHFKFDRVPNPAAIEKLILDLYEQLPDNIKLKAGMEK